MYDPMHMASLISTPTSFCYTSKTSRTAALYQPSSSCSISHHKNPKLSPSIWIPHLGNASFSQWSGLKQLGISVMPKFVNKERKGSGIRASLFGVGAPEALVIGVVALLVFGPKGLAEVARNLGKTLRAFQPTIRELQDVSREFKSTLEREIGLDDIPSQTQTRYRPNPVSTPPPVASDENSFAEAEPNGAPSETKAYTNEEFLKIREERLKASALQQQDPAPPAVESQLESQTEPQVPIKETAGATPPPQKPENEV
ncbi:sec-independent protein translocase protein TATB, chloroplastic [Mercurialis annua]|uniref:sec-independent protein translocase protein TATB, chloroplastic n=1 Tax=Mercurialis annua TaxID=3986 RepID=UPI00215E93C8|nr:sec-independent protein translocase protein TATB, chloroplastic [Mercurialis annua]